MDVSEVLAGLSSDLRKTLVFGEDIAYERQELPSIGLTRALNGGFPYGRQVLIYGSKSSAKSSFCLEMIGMAQKEGKVCAWIDAEMSFDNSWAQRLGVDTSQLIVSEARTINNMVDTGTQLMYAGADIIVVDSITSLLPSVYFDKKTENLRDLEDTGQMGQESKDFSRAVKMLNYANNRTKPTLLVLISQARNNLGMYTTQIPTGGNAVKYYSSIVIKLFSSESDSNSIKAKREVGNKIIQESVGRKVDWTVQFSKTSPAFETGSYNFYYRGEHIGINKEDEILERAVEVGIVPKSGAGGWYTIYDEKLQGEKATDYLRCNPVVKEKLLNELSQF